MRLKILKPVEPEVLDTKLQVGTLTKRHEFSTEGEKDAFVVFEGEEGTPFWRRKDGIWFVYTDLTYENCVATANLKDSFLKQATVDCDGGEFEKYYKEALDNHKNPHKT